MRYFLYKLMYRLMWKHVKKSDKKAKKNEPMPLNVSKEGFQCRVNSKAQKKLDFNIYYKDREHIKRPVILDIHGGGWAYGDKESNNNFCMHLANYGFNVVSLSYSLVFKGKLEDMIYEIAKLVDYLYKYRERFHLDFNNFFITGDSAGGHLTTYYTCCSLSKKLKNIYNLNNIYFPKINAIAPNHGAFYIKRMKLFEEDSSMQKTSKVGSRRMLFGKNYEESEQFKYCDIDELFEQLKNENMLDKFPPCLILTSDKDEFLTGQSYLLKQLLKENNLECELITTPNLTCNHIFNVFYPYKRESIRFNNKMRDFFISHFNKSN